MSRKTATKVARRIQPRIRVLHRRDIAIGPGKAELLDWVGKTGSIVEAARQMDMSYMRAWTLIRTMNGCFKKPLVTTSRGGQTGGGAALTETGQKALQLYQRMENASLRAVEGSWRKMQRLMQD